MRWLGSPAPSWTSSPPAFSRAIACEITGIEPGDLERWERSLSSETGLQLADVLSFSDLVSLAVLRVAHRNLGPSAWEFSLGFGQVFGALRAMPNVETLDAYAAVIGRDFARLATMRTDHLTCTHDDFVVIPLRPILADFRGQAFP
jgi:hypothetical protein